MLLSSAYHSDVCHPKGYTLCGVCRSRQSSMRECTRILAHENPERHDYIPANRLRARIARASSSSRCSTRFAMISSNVLSDPGRLRYLPVCLLRYGGQLRSRHRGMIRAAHGYTRPGTKIVSRSYVIHPVRHDSDSLCRSRTVQVSRYWRSAPAQVCRSGPRCLRFCFWRR